MTVKQPTPAQLATVLRFDEAEQRLVWLPRPCHLYLAGRSPYRSIINGYPTITALGRTHREHRVIWALYYGEWPQGEIDHIDGNPQNNRIENLRVVSRLQNAKNIPRRRDNTSGVIGVDWLEPNRKWRARIFHDGSHEHLGLFDTLQAAKVARKSAERRLGFHPNHGREPLMREAA